jgi:hypothetical protein
MSWCCCITFSPASPSLSLFLWLCRLLLPKDGKTCTTANSHLLEPLLPLPLYPTKPSLYPCLSHLPHLSTPPTPTHSLSPTSTQTQPHIQTTLYKTPPSLGHKTPSPINPFPTPSVLTVPIGSDTRPGFLLNTLTDKQPGVHLKYAWTSTIRSDSPGPARRHDIAWHGMASHGMAWDPAFCCGPPGYAPDADTSESWRGEVVAGRACTA